MSLRLTDWLWPSLVCALGLVELATLDVDGRPGAAACLLAARPARRTASLAAAVDVSAQRIVRAALTNALRYASDRAVRVEVAATDHGLTIRASNRCDSRTGQGSGLGPVGLRERVEVLDGTLRHGPTSDGRFELVARLPVVREPV